MELKEFWLTVTKHFFSKIENSNVWGQISWKLYVGFPPNVVCKTLKILSNNFQ